MDKQQTKKKSYAISVSETQKLVPTENNGKWGFLDAETGEVITPLMLILQ
ncbi:hypothetical protein FACS1894155_04710 [Bacteroidia bacterium]|nr:hypothetical protein FACS1894155_04710 [Bacteroidia bacterium]